MQDQGAVRRRLNIFDNVVGWVGDQLRKPRTEAAKRDQAAMADPDSTRTIAEMIKSRGFGFESHRVTTDDGYILTMHRLFSTEHKNKTRPVVFMQHGLGDTSETWVLNGDIAPAFTFANLGYDVWLGNDQADRQAKAAVGRQLCSCFWFRLDMQTCS